MEILEKLPGITVERHLLLHGSYTATRVDKMKSYENISNATPVQRSKYPREATTNRCSTSKSKVVTPLDNAQRRKNTRSLENRQIKNSFSVSSYHKYAAKPDVRLELEVLGKNPHNNLQENYPKDDTIAKQISSSASDQPPPVLKSILKRTGSGVSLRSCTLIEVMSLDSGMCRLAASLAAHKSAKGNLAMHGKASSKIDVKSSSTSENQSTDNANSMHEKHLKITAPHSETDAQKLMETNPTNISPTKSVSFKLDPEMQNREKERSLLSNRRGDARWGVVISSHQTRQPKERTKTTRRHDFSSSKRREIQSNASRFSMHELEKEAEKKRASETSENNLSVALLRHHVLKGKPSMNEIHQLSESYRKYLMSRALEQTSQGAKESFSSKKTITLKTFLAEAAAGTKHKDVSRKYKNSGLDKQYMSISNPPFSNKPPPYLPNVHYQK